MEPVVDRLRTEYEGVVEFRLVNAETDAESQALATRFGLQYVPSFVFLDSDGTQRDLVVGEVSEEDLRAVLDSLQ
ncbi:thioredoxin family protein [Anaerosoma tenue]|uniref:thioredoxin family protein n=1 Tax=Anaerosoma tenue TaxID=2933588 RepID=UPI0018364BBE|nr:thioredoxin family protein [Anaerosoma tenue]HHJ98908.1 thioredoxin [Actinomycetota bacterium]